ncbi:hypothetical protein ACFL49_02385 [Candidatus Omnitrophota bacterium]
MIKKITFLSLAILFVCTQVYAGAVIDRRRQMEQQQKEAARQAAMQKQAAIEQQMYTQAAAQKKQQRQMAAYQQQRTRGSQSQSQSQSVPLVEDEVIELHQIWEFFEEKSDLWAYMVDAAPKIKTVERYIKAYRQKGVYIHKDAEKYVELIDQMTAGNSALLNSPFADVLKFVAIMEYDFDNGKNKDALARHLLGEKVYQENQKRLGR